MISIQARRAGIMATYLVLMGGLVASLASCSAGKPTVISPSHARTAGVPGRTKARTTAPTLSAAPLVKPVTGSRSPLPVPAALTPFGRAAFTGEGTWHPSGRRVYGVPTVYQLPEFTAAGGLASYGGNLTDALRVAGLYSGRILKGEKPADLPIQQATKIELILNLKTAGALGINVPLMLRARADEVIE